MSVDLSYINEALRELAVPIDSLTPDPSNERVHDEKNMAAIKGSIARFGQHQVVTVWQEKNIIVAGNGRWQAMKEMGYSHIAANVRSLTEKQAAALRVADNRTGELARWDKNALEETAKALRDAGENLEDLGFTDDDLKIMFGSEFQLWEPTGGGDTTSKGSEYAEKVVVSVNKKELVELIKGRIKSIIADNGWSDRAEIV